MLPSFGFFLYCHIVCHYAAAATALPESTGPPPPSTNLSKLGSLVFNYSINYLSLKKKRVNKVQPTYHIKNVCRLIAGSYFYFEHPLLADFSCIYDGPMDIQLHVKW